MIIDEVVDVTGLVVVMTELVVDVAEDVVKIEAVVVVGVFK